MAEEKTILIHPVSKLEFTFGVDHAERILKLGHGWKRKKQTASAAKKRDTKATGSKAKQDDDCGCNKS